MILNSPTISGSLTVTGNIIASGSITLSGSVASASYAASASNALAAQTASFVLTAQTASFVLTAQTASFVALAQSASNAVSAVTASFANAFTVAGTLTAQTLVVQTITSSVSTITGSTNFGSLAINTHQFTGSVLISGSSTTALNVNNGSLFVSSSGNVGIGTSTPVDLLTLYRNGNVENNISIYNGTAGYGTHLRLLAADNAGAGYNTISSFTNGGTTHWTIGSGATTSTMVFYTNNDVERMRITSAGNVGIGTNSPNDLLEIKSTTANQGNLRLYNTFNSGASSYGIYWYRDYDSATNSLACSISYARGGGSDGDMKFSIGSVGSISERMRITSDGNIGIGKTPEAISTFRTLDIKGSTGAGIRLSDATNATNLQSAGGDFYINNISSGVIYFYNGNAEKMRITSGGAVYIGLTSSGTNVFAVSYNAIVSSLYVTNAGSVGSYTFGTGPVYANAGLLTMTNPSDSRLKDNINNISWGLSDILKLRPVSYHWKDDKINQGVQFGFVAQEVQEVMPEAIKEFGEDTKYLGLEKDAIYATLVKAIQELKTQNDALQSRIETLESK